MHEGGCGCAPEGWAQQGAGSVLPPSCPLQLRSHRLRPAGEELSCSGHLGTEHCPEHPAPRPHRFSSFLPFSSLINHTLLPNLNMEMPGRETQPSPGLGGWVAVRLQRREHRGLACFLVCVKLWAQRRLLSECVN